MGFRFLNIPVMIQPTFWIFLVVFCFLPQGSLNQMMILGLVLCFSLLFHEYGHALAAQKFGRNPTITLEGIGGYASYDGRDLKEIHHFVITLCGPIFTGMLILISKYLLVNHVFNIYAVNYFLHCTMHLNIYWLIVNLAPLLPLDGGKIAEYLIRKIVKEDRARQFSLILGNITALIGGAYFLLNGSYMFAYLFLFHGWQNFQVYTFEFIKQKPSSFSLYNQAVHAAENNENKKAKAIFMKLSKSEDDYFKIRSLEGLAEILSREGKSNEACAALMKVSPEKLNHGKYLLCKLAFAQGNYKLVETLSVDIYKINPTFDTAMLNAKTFSLVNNPDYSIAWLKTAFQFDDAKNMNLEELLVDKAFDTIRDHPSFQDLAQCSLRIYPKHTAQLRS
jgi:Zn-dependent protease